MPEELSVKRMACAFSAFFAIAYIVCLIVYVIAPEQAVGLFNYLSHSTIPVTIRSLEAAEVVIGFVLTLMLSAIAGALFAWIYNKCPR